ncbi:MAG: hypothetical protein B6229_10920 [Spirochaetaceae bacterium 4572_7]|nr:MAG: hypothetical protein B6229_10920 [Spirochaetaceae bacterium 4572_7]
MINSFFEAGMLLCFGMAWPISIYKSLKSKTNNGKSLFFLIIIFIGYISGTLFKITGHPDKVLILYLMNGTMVLTDILIYFRNRKLEAI